MSPEIEGDVRVIKFPSGRLERHLVNNVVAIGNSSGFVEPIEATALLVVTDQINYACKVLLDSGGEIPDAMRDEECSRIRSVWDDIRDFIVLHYKFNKHWDTPFWEQCRNDLSLGGAEGFCEYYREAGPSTLSKRLLNPDSVFGFEGYMNILIGSKAETKCPPRLYDQDWKQWANYTARTKQTAAQALTTEQALKDLSTGDHHGKIIEV
jgi:tryptophan halogenase